MTWVLSILESSVYPILDPRKASIEAKGKRIIGSILDKIHIKQTWGSLNETGQEMGY